MSRILVGKALKLIWHEISYLARGKKLGTVEVKFREVDITRLHSVTPLRTEEVVFLPVYLGKSASRVRREDTT